MRSPFGRSCDSVHFLDMLNVHQSLGMHNVIFHERQQIGAAGEHFSLRPKLAPRSPDGLLFG